MRVIENNYKDEPKEFDMVCPHCNSKLAYYESDIEKIFEKTLDKLRN